MTAYTAWYDYVLPELPGVPTAVVDFITRQVAIEFCRETCVHTTEVTPINVVAGTAEYTLSSPVANTDVVVVKGAWYDDTPLDIYPLDLLVDKNPQWGDDTSSTPWAYVQRQPDKLILYPSPTESLSSGLRVEVVIAPTLGSTSITDWIATKYMYDIACGIKGKLMAQPAKPWTNAESATYYLAMFSQAKAKAKGDVNRSFTRAALSVRQRPAC